MAVKKKSDDATTEEVILDDKPQEIPEIVIKEESKPAKEQLVRVKPNATYHTKIGGTYYYFEKGVCQNVPENVKRIMAEGQMLMVL